MYPASHLPTGTVTFIFSDADPTATGALEGAESEDAYLTQYNTLLRDVVEAHGGLVYKTIGYSSQIAFSTAQEAVTAAIEAQHALRDLPNPLPVRLALHSGVTQERAGGDYFGPLLNRVARMLAASHGGQIILSQVTEELVRDALPPGVSLRDLGEHRLRDLTNIEHIYQVVAPGLLSEFPPLKTMEARANNLPVQPTPIVGRSREVQACRDLLLNEGVWLLTLTGPGGIGKSRLAIHLAAEMLDDFADGVFFVPLAPISDPDLLIPTICQALDVRESRGHALAEILREYLRDKQMLLLLDNFEHVIGAATVVSELLEHAPQIKIVVTSRMSLRVSGEREFPVPPLQLPDVRQLPPLEKLSQYEAVELFIERALAVKPDFAVTNENAPAVAEICVRLDGLPLAIELAAARVKLLAPLAILARLDNRLKLLTGGGRDVPARQQTLRATIDWSFDLLDPAEKLLFSSLSVFAGCSFEAAESLWAMRSADASASRAPDIDVLDGLWSLVDKNLIRQQEWEGEEPRFFMLETIREYGLEQLGAQAEVDTIRRWHAEYFLELAVRAERELTGQRQGYWLGLLELEHENLRCAMRWAIEHREVDLGLRLASALWRFWYIRSHYTEGLDWLRKVLDISQQVGNTALRARALNGAGNMAYNLGDYAQARSLHEQSLAISQALNDTRAMAPSYNNLGHLARRRGEYDLARALLTDALNLSRSIGNKTLEATSLNNLGLVAYDQGNYAEARALQEESLSIFTGAGDTWGTAMALGDLGKVVFEQGDYRAANELYERSLALQEELGDRTGIAVTLLSLGKAAHAQSGYSTAEELYTRSLAVFRELGEKRGTADALHGLAKVAFRRGDYVEAKALFGDSLSLRQELGDRRYIAESLNNLGLVELAQGSYVKAESLLESSLAMWRGLESKARIPTALNNLGLVEIMRKNHSAAQAYLEESLAMFRKVGRKSGSGFALLNLGLAHFGVKEYPQALACYRQSLELFRELGDKLHVAVCLERLAVLCSATDDPQRAARLSGAAEAVFEALGTPPPTFERSFYDPALDAARVALGDRAFEAARAEGRAMREEEAAALALSASVHVAEAPEVAPANG